MVPVWIVLHYNQDANIKYATLNLLKCANDANGGYNYDTDQSNIKRILERYNGSGDAAVEYGDVIMDYINFLKNIMRQ